MCGTLLYKNYRVQYTKYLIQHDCNKGACQYNGAYVSVSFSYEYIFKSDFLMHVDGTKSFGLLTFLTPLHGTYNAVVSYRHCLILSHSPLSHSLYLSLYSLSLHTLLIIFLSLLLHYPPLTPLFFIFLSLPFSLSTSNSSLHYLPLPPLFIIHF